MHGNTPYTGPSEDADLSSEQLRALQSDVASVTEQTRALLPDEFVVGSELTSRTDGTHGTVSVQPPVGRVISTGVPTDASDETHSDLAHELAAGAALQVKRAISDVDPTAG
ncbi:DUF5811 family protein [Halocatena pleomorpha]|uniref:Uncharacterized protein n=1 Tax=Halocatena pleomorpha TaxID=1785090 RepID=A0A3P3RFW6_9EURY|nr:DUF5811 family protein [Halocatena pleomorpha]RRJ32332.1 hypothetical protein EIK79_04895 [Halocatena pleomorpha]